MIIEEKNPKKQEREEIKKIFKMLGDVKLPKNYKFVDDCVEIRFYRFFGIIDSKVAEINLEKDILEINFIDEEEMNRLKNSFRNSKTKFKLRIEEEIEIC